MEDKINRIESTWESPLPEDEIARQQRVRERLTQGMSVELKGLGKFMYAGLWDTMHTFYPSEGQDLDTMVEGTRRRYLKRDLRGRLYLLLPYTLLADNVIIG